MAAKQPTVMALAPAKVAQPVQPSIAERLDRLTSPRTLISIVLLVGGLGLLAWMFIRVGIAEIRRRMGATHIVHQPTPASGPRFAGSSEQTAASPSQADRRFNGGPRHVSLQLKASEPSLRRTAPVPLAKGDKPSPLDHRPAEARNLVGSLD